MSTDHFKNRRADNEQVGGVNSADSMQVGGTHYKDMQLSPWTVMESVLTYDEFIGFLKGNIIKYAMRQGLKTEGDAEKAKHYMAKLNEMTRDYY
jgi:hypothetical protein